MNTSNTTPHTWHQRQRPYPQFAHPAAYCGMPARPLYLASQEPAANCGMLARPSSLSSRNPAAFCGMPGRQVLTKWKSAAFCGMSGRLLYSSLRGGRARGEVQQTKTLWHSAACLVDSSSRGSKNLWHTAACPADCSAVSRSPTAALSHPSPGGRGAGGDVRETCGILGHARSPVSRHCSLNHPLCAYDLSAAYDVEHHIYE